jgi:hypothetical protein
MADDDLDQAGFESDSTDIQNRTDELGSKVEEIATRRWGRIASAERSYTAWEPRWR